MPAYARLVMSYKDAERKKKGLPGVQRIARLVDANCGSRRGRVTYGISKVVKFSSQQRTVTLWRLRQTLGNRMVVRVGEYFFCVVTDGTIRLTRTETRNM